jgi:hypothetical protein
MCLGASDLSEMNPGSKVQKRPFGFKNRFSREYWNLHRKPSKTPG